MGAPERRDDRISGTVGEDVETTGKSERRSIDEGATRADDSGAMRLDPTAEAADAEDTELCEATPCAVDGDGAEDAVVTGGADAVDETAGEPEGDAPVTSDGVAKLRGMAQFNVNSDWLRTIWRAHSIARIAFLAVLVCSLAVSSAYLFVMQPSSIRLQEIREQKSMLHDYVVIQQAEAAIGAFRNGLMTGDQRMTVMSEVRLMAEGSGVKIVGDPDLLLRRDASGHFVEYPIRLRVRSGFHEMGEFLSLLEGSPRFVLVEEVEIRSDVASRSSESEATVLLALAAWEG